MKKNLLAFVCFLFLVSFTTKAQKPYDPLYWLEGTFDHAQITEQPTEEQINSKIDSAYAKGWRGVTSFQHSGIRSLEFT